MGHRNYRYFYIYLVSFLLLVMYQVAACVTVLAVGQDGRVWRRRKQLAGEVGAYVIPYHSFVCVCVYPIIFSLSCCSFSSC